MIAPSHHEALPATTTEWKGMGKGQEWAEASAFSTTQQLHTTVMIVSL